VVNVNEKSLPLPEAIPLFVAFGVITYTEELG
jgi:hypothetical protein